MNVNKLEATVAAIQLLKIYQIISTFIKPDGYF